MPTIARKIGRYVLLEPLGRGAMGVVYRAEDPAIHRTVAVKVLHTNNGLTEQQVDVARERFIREGQAAGGIDHPNIIRVFDVGEDDESREMYIVMEFVPGPSLEKMLQGDGLEPPEAIALIGQIAAGLDAAHARGFIHRDIKPSNILMTDDGTAKIADFGITHVATSALTQDLAALGTPAYMSPEQVGGKAVTSRSDLFSLGVLSYEILARRKPFEGADIVSTAHAIAALAPDLISVANPGLPASLDGVLARMLSKEPSERFGSGKEFHEALRSGFQEAAPRRTSRPVPVTSKRPYVVWGLAGAALVAAAIVMLFARGEPPAATPEPKAASPDPVPRVAEPAAPTAAKPVKKSAVAPAKTPPPRRAEKKESVVPVPPPAKPATGAPAKTVAHEPKPSVAKVAEVVAPPQMANVTISLAHRVRRGTLVLSLDGATIFDEKFSKSRLALFQTTIWDPVHAPAGEHTLVATVNGEDGKTYVSDPTTVEFPSGKDIGLKIGLKGAVVTIKKEAD